MIKQVTRKSFDIKESSRSTDFLTPTFIMGCGYECLYCYCKRHKTEGVDIATNVGDILTAINDHAWFTEIEKPNQTHDTYISYDIGCNNDVALHYKHLNWNKVFDFFVDHPKAMGSFATKYVNTKLLDYNPKQKMRIRFSLMPQIYADQLEPKTSLIIDRINAIDKFITAGWDVHVNYSPVIVVDGWLEEYKKLFKEVDNNVKNKNLVKAEVIFLTHNEKKHNNNLNIDKEAEKLLWKPKIQENKISQYGGENIRYKSSLKKEYIEEFIRIHSELIPWNSIRYIF
jgi:spore photoproduct lyase